MIRNALKPSFLASVVLGLAMAGTSAACLNQVSGFVSGSAFQAQNRKGKPGGLAAGPSALRQPASGHAEATGELARP